MTMKVRFEFKGSVFCHRRDGFWNFDFVGDDHHLAQYVVEKKSGGTTGETAKGWLMQDGRIRTGRFSPAVAASGSGQETRPVELLNMSRPEMHGADASGSNLLLRIKTGISLVRLAVPLFRLDALETTSRDYYIMRDPDTTDPFPSTDGAENIGPVASRVGGEVEVSADAAIRFDDGGTIPFAYERGAEYVIKFDNDCRNRGSSHDFRLYYTILEDKRGSGYRFLAGKYGPVNAAEKALFSSEFGNCDPVGSEPPPGP
jgi:hypothetical protein